MNRISFHALLLAGICAALLPLSTHAQSVPSLLNYQGRVVVGTTNFTGTGLFKFALVNAGGTTTYWSNDGTSTNGSQPTNAVSLGVNSGLYALALGDTTLTNMTAIPASVFTNNTAVYLRVWFNDGVNGSQLLTPDERITSVGYAMLAANVPAGAITATQLAAGSVTNGALASGAVTATDIASGTITATQLAAGSVGSTQLASNLTAGGTLTVGAVLALPNTTSASSGLVKLGNAAFLHNYGTNNAFIGANAGNFTMTGSANTASGGLALFSNTSGSYNTASGYQALCTNTGGTLNTASGYQALYSNTTASNNTASGYQALTANTTGGSNTASGSTALYSNTDGSSNTASGSLALYSNTTGDSNTADGFQALGGATTGHGNCALGYNAGFDVTTGSNNVEIANVGNSGDSGVIRIGTPGAQGTTFIAGISGATATSGVAVYVNSSGLLGTMTSSARYKRDIRDMDRSSEAILALRPVDFEYKPEIDPEATPQFGLVAEEVEKVCPALVAHDDRGQVYTVRYEAVNAMLLNEFLKDHRHAQEVEKGLREENAAMQQRLTELEKLRGQNAAIIARLADLEAKENAREERLPPLAPAAGK